jgi:hypothetical protein
MRGRLEVVVVVVGVAVAVGEKVVGAEGAS